MSLAFYPYGKIINFVYFIGNETNNNGFWIYKRVKKKISYSYQHKSWHAYLSR